MKMNDTDETPGTPEDGGRQADALLERQPPRYDRWLYAALAATALGALALAWVFSGLLSNAAPERPTRQPPAASAHDRLVVAVARTAGGPSNWADYTRITKLLSERLGRQISVRYIPRESEAVPALSKTPADIAFVCSRTYLTLDASGTYTGVALPVIDGASSTEFMFVALRGSGITSFDDLRGRRIAASDRTSLGGWAYVQWVCDRRGTDVGSYFSEVNLGDSMDRNLADLRSGRIDATVVNRVQAEPSVLRGLVVFERAGPIPNPPVVVNTALDAATRAAITDALLSLDSEQLASRSHRLGGFVRLDPKDFALAAEIAAACDDQEHMR